MSPLPATTTVLLLTTVAFKYTISEDLPNISYLTTMDSFVFVNIMCLVETCVLPPSNRGGGETKRGCGGAGSTKGVG